MECLWNCKQLILCVLSSVVNSAKLRIDETAACETQLGPVDAASELARQVPLKKRAGVVGIRKGRFDELVMRLVDRTICHEGKENAKNKK